ncbi:hypothetical protein [Streptomyces omiyaensis]|uniref:hypothetical protein n=1 Tax=Streptomyces omiyaensis TaxID=68247 RepID=UPI00167A2F5C|nr:hypothetical protein [Streptomyces omiyaensis]GGY50814.1 hypothetical protein GCM10010363_34690 [Streptomyces omiyaensis]
MANLVGESSDPGVPAIKGTHTTGEAVHAVTNAADVAAIAAFGLNPDGGGAALFAKKEGNKGHAGFFLGNVFVKGNAAGAAVWGESENGEAVHAATNATNVAAVAAFATNEGGTGAALYAEKRGSGGHAGFFVGDVFVTGDVGVSGDLVLTGGDVAEQFDVAEREAGTTGIDPGTVVVLDDEGALAPCREGYDPRVAGVVSGAGDRVPALILDRRKPGAGQKDVLRRAVAVVGKVWCLADASSKPIHVGDLLTTATTPGHTMAATDREAAFGAVLGKALTPLASGTGMVLVLVGLG